MERCFVTVDGNEAAANVAFQANEVVAIDPITPASPMAGMADAWSAAGRRNPFGTAPQVNEMQREGGAAGTVHGALQAGALSTTFTASQGPLLMIPNMFKVAGELTPPVFRIAARPVASPFEDFAMKEARFTMLSRSNPARAERLLAPAQKDIDERWHFYEQMAGVERTAPAPMEEVTS